MVKVWSIAISIVINIAKYQSIWKTIEMSWSIAKSIVLFYAAEFFLNYTIRYYILIGNNNIYIIYLGFIYFHFSVIDRIISISYLFNSKVMFTIFLAWWI